MRVLTSMSTARFPVFLLLVSLTSFFAQAARAQDSHPKFELFSEGGISTTNQFSSFQEGLISIQPLKFEFLSGKSSLRTTGRFFGGVRLWVDKNQALEASYSYSPGALVSSITCVGSCSGTFMESIPLRENFFAGNYVHTLPKFADLHPFLTAGAGGMNLAQQYAGSVKHDPFAVNLGGGLERPLSYHWALRAEYRDWIYDMPHFATSGSGLVHNMVPSIGPVFRF